MPRRAAPRALSLIAGLTLLLAGAAIAAAVLFAVALRDERVFGALSHVVALLFSRTGVNSPTGIEILRTTMAATARLASGLAVAAIAGAFLLRRVVKNAQADPVEPVAAALETRPEEFWWRPSLWTSMAVAIVGIGAALRIPRLSTSLFYDEIFSIQNFAELALFKIPFAQIEANNHVLNSVLLHLMLKVSSAEFVLRLPTYLAGVGTLWLIYLLGRQIGGSLVGLLALALMVTSPFHLWYSTLARGYMLGLFFGMMALIVLLRSSGPPSRRELGAFALAQGVAILAMPTAAVVPVLLVAFLMIGTFQWARRWTGIDPSSVTGMAWLTTVLGTVGVIGVLQLPQIGFFIMRASRGPADERWSFSVGEAFEWLGVLQQLPVVAPLVALVALLLAVAHFNRQPGIPWTVRFLFVLFVASLLFLLRSSSPARAHLLAFLGIVLCTAIGARLIVTSVAGRLGPREVQPWAGGAVTAALIVAIVLASGVSLVEAARGYPFQDIRGAVKLSESVVGSGGGIVTSGFGDREIAYYTARPVRVLRSDAELAELVAARQPFCYFRLYPEAGKEDRVYAALQSSAGSPLVVDGREPISVWCLPRRPGRAEART